MGFNYYDAAWAEYEEIHGEEHPCRYFDRMAPRAHRPRYPVRRDDQNC